jgi:hypothetical protein
MESLSAFVKCLYWATLVPHKVSILTRIATACAYADAVAPLLCGDRDVRFASITIGRSHCLAVTLGGRLFSWGASFGAVIAMLQSLSLWRHMR